MPLEVKEKKFVLLEAVLCNIVPFLGEEKLACTILEQLTKVERFDMVLLFLSAEEKNGKDVEGFLFLLCPIFFSFLFFLFRLRNKRYWGLYWRY